VCEEVDWMKLTTVTVKWEFVWEREWVYSFYDRPGMSWPAVLVFEEGLCFMKLITFSPTQISVGNALPMF